MQIVGGLLGLSLLASLAIVWWFRGHSSQRLGAAMDRHERDHARARYFATGGDLPTERLAVEDDANRAVTDARVRAVTGFPPRVLVELVTADGETLAAWLPPVRAHALSDDLLRAAAACKRANYGEAKERAG